MRKKTWKFGLVFFLYSLLITAVFLGSIFVFQRDFQNFNRSMTVEYDGYVMSDPTVQSLPGQLAFPNPQPVLSPSQINQQYHKQMIQVLIPLSIFFCLFMLVSAIVFWLVLRKLQEKNSRQIAGRLRTIANADAPWESDQDLEPAYAVLRHKMEAHFEDYKRLSSYLSHEQKNAIARMRTSMELENMHSYLDDLDALTDGLDDILTMGENQDAGGQRAVDVAVVCAEVCDAYRKVTDTVSFDFDETADTVITGKERWIVRALSNLVDNAVKYGEGKPVDVHVQSKYDSVVVTVRDRGIGINQDQQKKIFGNRYRVNALNRDGYGIGLSLVSHVCDLCGGFVTVDSTPGEGSTFYLSFPKTQPVAQKEALSKQSVCYTACCKPDADPGKQAEGANHMYVFTNALKNIWRNKGRNILLFFIVLLMILSTVVSIVINTATGAVISSYKEKFGSEVTLIRSNKKIEEQNVQLDQMIIPTLEDYQKYGESDLLKSKEIAANAIVSLVDMKTSSQGNSGGAVLESGSTAGDSILSIPVATVVGSSNPQISAEFLNGQRKIVEGSMYAQKNECVVSQKFAQINDLKVGSVVTFTEYSYTNDNKVEQSLTVSGIYEDNVPQSEDEASLTSIADRSNEILTDLDTFTSLPVYDSNKDTGMLDIQVSFVLKNPNTADAFEQELYDKGLPNYYLVSADTAAYNKVVGPVESISRIVTIFLVVVLVLGSLVLILLSTLAIRERKYEVGVLRAMGMKKMKVAMGLISEMLVITAACLVIGLGIGAAASQPIADSMLQSQVQSAQADSPEINNTEVSSGLQISQVPVSEIDVSLNGAAVGQISLIALLLAAVSSMAGIVFITRYEPIKILSERN